MSNYILILIWIAVVGMVSMMVNVQRTEMVCGQKVRRVEPIWAFIIFLPLIIWTGYRGIVGDTYAYTKMFKELPETFSGIPAYMSGVSKDKGFYFLSAIIKGVIGDRVNIYFLIIAAAQAIMLIRVYRKYSTRYVMCFFLFIASTDYISWMFNGIRQFLAVTITFSCFELILNKKYIPAIIVILIASTIHGTALLVIPFIFIAQGKTWNKKTILFIIGVMVAVIFIERFTDILDTMLVETQYKNVVSDWKEWEDDGTNVLRVLVYSVPAILSLIGRKYIEKENNPVMNLCTNMSIVAMGFYIVSMFTSGIFIGRLPIYFSLYSYILLPWEIEHMFTRRSAQLVYMAMIAGYLGFYFYTMRMMGVI